MAEKNPPVAWGTIKGQYIEVRPHTGEEPNEAIKRVAKDHGADPAEFNKGAPPEKQAGNPGPQKDGAPLEVVKPEPAKAPSEPSVIRDGEAAKKAAGAKKVDWAAMGQKLAAGIR